MQINKTSGFPVFCQLLSYIPKEVISECVSKHESDRYYKTMTTYKQLVFMLYGVITKSPSLQGLCKSLLFLEGKLSYVGIREIAPVTTLSDANINRHHSVFEDIYYCLYNYYIKVLKGGFVCLPINGEAHCDKIKRFDATTFTLFSAIFKGVGRNPESGNKKGGVKAQTLESFDSLVPEYIELGASANNDKDFLGQLEVKKGFTYVFDKGYVNYEKFRKWTENEVFFVTRLNENAKYTVVERKVRDATEVNNPVLSDEVILLNTGLKLRLVTYKDPVKGKILKFLSNHFEYEAQTIALIYKNRWAIEPFFKQLKQNFQLTKFFSDKPEGILTQIWIAFIANLIFTVIFQQIQQQEAFTSIVTMAASNLGSYLCLIKMAKKEKLKPVERNNEIVQLELFEVMKGGVFETKQKSP
jgi:hypothetical protein